MIDKAAYRALRCHRTVAAALATTPTAGNARLLWPWSSRRRHRLRPRSGGPARADHCPRRPLAPRRDRPRSAETPSTALDRAEEQIRELTGQVEMLTFSFVRRSSQLQAGVARAICPGAPAARDRRAVAPAPQAGHRRRRRRPGSAGADLAAPGPAARHVVIEHRAAGRRSRWTSPSGAVAAAPKRRPTGPRAADRPPKPGWSPRWASRGRRLRARLREILAGDYDRAEASFRALHRDLSRRRARRRRPVLARREPLRPRPVPRRGGRVPRRLQGLSEERQGGRHAPQARPVARRPRRARGRLLDLCRGAEEISRSRRTRSGSGSRPNRPSPRC